MCHFNARLYLLGTGSSPNSGWRGKCVVVWKMSCAKPVTILLKTTGYCHTLHQRKKRQDDLLNQGQIFPSYIAKLQQQSSLFLFWQVCVLCTDFKRKWSSGKAPGLNRRLMDRMDRTFASLEHQILCDFSDYTSEANFWFVMCCCVEAKQVAIIHSYSTKYSFNSFWKVWGPCWCVTYILQHQFLGWFCDLCRIKGRRGWMWCSAMQCPWSHIFGCKVMCFTLCLWQDGRKGGKFSLERHSGYCTPQMQGPSSFLAISKTNTRGAFCQQIPTEPVE